jgi:hypothetical protein
LGRYPVHWHQGKTMAAGQAVLADSSIHHCYQRCLTIHDTNGNPLASFDCSHFVPLPLLSNLKGCVFFP